MSDNSQPKSLPLALDGSAQSASDIEPAFIARPAGAPVYHGFRVLEDVVVDGFTFGMISDFEAELRDWGDAFVIAPDGSRCGLVWEAGENGSIYEIAPLEKGRWGVWGVTFPTPMRSRDDARENLAALLPQLRSRWQEWRKMFGESRL